ncbi:MAG: hypothetical protein IK152_03100 [Lachnospiraceae bacterium]|nr:hypothetical protein [Lachnospiraceae bacterium]
MSVLQLSLLVVGVILLLASFFVTERLSKKEVDELSRLSSAQLQKVVDKEISGIEDKVTDIVGDAVDKAAEDLQRPMEKLSNEKIMAINEYSDTVMDDINKGHSEVLFLFNMMKEKENELKTLLSSIERNKAQLREMSDNVRVMEQKTEAAVNGSVDREDDPDPERSRSREDIRAAEAAMDKLLKEGVEAIAEREAKQADPERPDPGFVFRQRDEDEVSDLPESGSDEKAELRKKIIEMYDAGVSEVEIGKRLRCGVGEVRLVIELVNRGERFEV